MTIAEIAAKNADKTRQKPVKGGRGGGRGGQKKQPQPKKTVTTRSSSAESRSSESANDAADTKSSKKNLTTAEAKKLAHKSIFSDSDSESGNKRPRSPPFRTKVCMFSRNRLNRIFLGEEKPSQLFMYTL